MVDVVCCKYIEWYYMVIYLLYVVLCNVVGDGVCQVGFFVYLEWFCFDFMYFVLVIEEQQFDVMCEVSYWICEVVFVGIVEEFYDNVVERGVMVFFGEKYGDEVCIVEVLGFSFEFCGGCYVGNIGEIGNFVIVSECGVVCGVCCIEVLCGEFGESWQCECEYLL